MVGRLAVVAVVFAFSSPDNTAAVRQLMVAVAHKVPLAWPKTGEIKLLSPFPITQDCIASPEFVLVPWRSAGVVKDASSRVSSLDPER